MPRHPLLTDEEVLSRARAVFVERGYEAARTKQIAAAVGLTWGAIALRFGDKRSLFQRAMGGPLCSAGELACEHAGSADLAGLLQQVRSRLWERWPLRLQYCLATPVTEQTHEPDPLLHGLAAVLEAHARLGALRTDLNAKALAQFVLALLIGDVAQRFAARESTLAPDPVFIDGVVRLLSAG